MISRGIFQSANEFGFDLERRFYCFLLFSDSVVSDENRALPGFPYAKL